MTARFLTGETEKKEKSFNEQMSR